MSTPQPLYDVANATPAYYLRYSWSGWPKGGTFKQCPSELLTTVGKGLETNGIKLLEHRWTSGLLQVTVSTLATVSPVVLAQRIKGRLDHSIRDAKLLLPFSRKLAVRSLGENRRVDVEQYIQQQVSKERFADPNFERKLKSFTIVNSDVDLSKPTSSARGRYWYNLHLVLVTSERCRITDLSVLALLRDTCAKIAVKKGLSISVLSVMPDHLHVALRSNIADSPVTVGRSFQNNLAYVVGNRHLWADGFYVGTFGEYNMNAIRRVVGEGLSHHPDELDGAVRSGMKSKN